MERDLLRLRVRLRLRLRFDLKKRGGGRRLELNRLHYHNLKKSEMSLHTYTVTYVYGGSVEDWIVGDGDRNYVIWTWIVICVSVTWNL